MRPLPAFHLQINDHCLFLQRDDHGFSPLHWACREGRSAVVEMLIMRGARINVMNRGDDTPLHLAASHGHRDIVQKVCMITSVPYVSHRHCNILGKVCVLFSLLTCLNTLSFGTDCAFCLFFLLSGPGNQLLQYKADINAVNEHGNVPLHYACFWGQDQVAEVSTRALSPGMGGKSEPQGGSGVLILSCEHCRVQDTRRI